MSRHSLMSFVARLAALVVVLAVVIAPAFAQGNSGKVTVTVLDTDHRIVQGAHLELVDLATNDVRKADTQDAGSYTFSGLPVGNFKLTVSKDNFTTQVFTIVVETAVNTDVPVTLAVGAVSTVVNVEAQGEAIETSSNATTTTINTKDIEDLPLSGRSLTTLNSLTPGYAAGTWNGVPVVDQGNNVDGVFGGPERMKFSGNSSPAIAPRIESMEEMTVQTDQIDLNQGGGQASTQFNYVTRRGTNSWHGRLYEDFRNSDLNANSWVSDANATPKARLELNDFGASVGGPIFHNKLFFFVSFAESVQPGSATESASVLNPANPVGGTFGTGPQQGYFTYIPVCAAGTACASSPATLTSGQQTAAPYVTCSASTVTCTVNLLAAGGLIPSYNTSTENSLPTAINGIVHTQLGLINTSLAAGNSLVQSTSDPNLETLSWLSPAATTEFFPAIRVDYNLSKKVRVNVAWNDTRIYEPAYDLPFFPGSSFSDTGAQGFFNSYTLGLGVDYNISSHVINQFRGGFQYNYDGYGVNPDQALYSTEPSISGSYTSLGTSGYITQISSLYPSFNFTDTLNIQHGSHNISLGVSWWREQDHYWNGVEGFDSVILGLNSGDVAATGAFTIGSNGAVGALPNSNTTIQGNAENLYAQLVGRINTFANASPMQTTYLPATGQYTSVGSIHAYNLDELQGAAGLFFQDAWKIRPSFTFNYGLRWDFTGDDHDLGVAYHAVTTASAFGPTAPGQLFTPGALNGDQNPQFAAIPHAYNSWYIDPQPSFGFAWNPSMKEGFFSRIMGSSGQTVVRAGYSLRSYTEPTQFFWDAASDQGQFFYQNFSLTPSSGSVTVPGNFAPGSLNLPNTMPNSPVPTPQVFGAPSTVSYLLSPATYTPTAPFSEFSLKSFPAGSVNSLNPTIGQPYIQTWNIGIQRSLGASRAIEISYHGNHSVRQWLYQNINEVNIENGFLTAFQQAQNNYKINQAAGAAGMANNAASFESTSFADYGLAGEVATPFFNTVFTNIPGVNTEGTSCGGQASGFCNSTFINDIALGGAGSMASTLSSGNTGAASYFCNLVGVAAFAPCGTNLGLTTTNTPGGGYPINFWQANPYAAGNSVYYMTDNGSSNYNALQVDFRQRTWRGLQFDANYTWQHTLGISTDGSYLGQQTNVETLRDMQDSYLPTPYDLRQRLIIQGTYDLPLGRGKTFLNHGGVEDRIVGGWTAGTILTYQTGAPDQFGGSGVDTFNNVAGSGIALTGVSLSQLQSAIGVYPVTEAQNGGVRAAFVDGINPQYMLSVKGGANTAFVNPNITAGLLSVAPFLYGPHQFADNISLSKAIPITERVHFTFQGEFLNAFNHPTFGTPTLSVLSTSFGKETPGGIAGARVIEFRANLTF